MEKWENEIKNGKALFLTDSYFFDALCKYDVEQIGEIKFKVLNQRSEPCSDSDSQKAMLRDFAIEWQSNINDYNYSWGDCCEYDAFFYNYGKKLGLLDEFVENGICGKDDDE